MVVVCFVTKQNTLQIVLRANKWGVAAKDSNTNKKCTSKNYSCFFFVSGWIRFGFFSCVAFEDCIIIMHVRLGEYVLLGLGSCVRCVKEILFFFFFFIRFNTRCDAKHDDVVGDILCWLHPSQLNRLQTFPISLKTHSLCVHVWVSLLHMICRANKVNEHFATHSRRCADFLFVCSREEGGRFSLFFFSFEIDTFQGV